MAHQSSPLPGATAVRSVRGVRAGTACVAVLLFAVAWAGAARAQVCMDSDCLPPFQSAYFGASTQNYSWPGLPVVFANAVHDSFTACDPAPLSLGTTVHSYGSVVHGIITLGASPARPFSASALVTVRVTSIGTIGSTRYFDTEMLQLDISGGTLPAGVRIRESPTIASLGKTDISPFGGGFAIDSFFDVFTELSLDGGQQWVPSQSPPLPLTATQPACPDPARRTSWGSIKDLYR